MVGPGHPRILAAQAVVVGVLMVVVFITLLQPEGDSDLFGIEAPGTTEITQRSDQRADGRGDRGGRGEPRGRPGAPGGGEVQAGADRENPADDQYADAVARLTAKLY